jgi:hypothetical protein
VTGEPLLPLFAAQVKRLYGGRSCPRVPGEGGSGVGRAAVLGSVEGEAYRWGTTACGGAEEEGTRGWQVTADSGCSEVSACAWRAVHHDAEEGACGG